MPDGSLMTIENIGRIMTFRCYRSDPMAVTNFQWGSISSLFTTASAIPNQNTMDLILIVLRRRMKSIFLRINFSTCWTRTQQCNMNFIRMYFECKILDVPSFHTKAERWSFFPKRWNGMVSPGHHWDQWFCNGFTSIEPSALNVFDQLIIVHTAVSGMPLEQYDELLVWGKFEFGQFGQFNSFSSSSCLLLLICLWVIIGCSIMLHTP